MQIEILTKNIIELLADKDDKFEEYWNQTEDDDRKILLDEISDVIYEWCNEI